jgi:ArsR family transcriptional regulator
MKKTGTRLVERKAEMFNALAHPLRLEIVEFLRGGERCVCEIVDRIDAEQSNTSRHLALMVRAGVLARRKQGLKVFYRVRWTCVFQFLGCVDGVLREELKETQRLLKGRRRRAKG